MIWIASTLDDVSWGFKKVIILISKKKAVLPIAPLFDLGVKLTFKCSL